MRQIILFLLAFLVLSLPLWAQVQPQSRFAAGGLGYFSQAQPQFQGWAAFGLPLTPDGKTLSYTDSDWYVVKTGGQVSVAGFQLRYSLRTGLAYRLLQTKDGAWSLYGFAAPGFVADGQSFMSAFQYGGFLHRTIKNGWGILVGLTNEHYGSTSDLAPRIGFTKKF